MQRTAFYLFAFCTLLPAAGAPLRVFADDTPTLETRVQAAFIFNFMQFTQWPGGAFAKSDDPIVVGFLGPSPVADVLRAIAAAKTIEGRAISIRQYELPSEAVHCHVLIVGDSFSNDIDAALRDVKSAPVLTIGDFDGFADAGGIIQFFIDDGKERFEINTLAAERAHLTISSKLLKLAKVVRK